MRIYALDETRKKEIYDKIYKTLHIKEEILFAYLHGSFLNDDFQDIDIVIYLQKTNKQSKTIKYELALERELETVTGFPIDARVINHAPLSFKFNVIKKGVLIFTKDDRKRCDFECLTFVKYHDFNFFRKIYKKEAIGIEV